MTIYEKVLELDRARRAAMISADTDTLASLLADDLVLVHTSARVDTKETLLTAIRSGVVNYRSIKISDDRWRRLGDTVLHTGIAAIIAGVDGAPVTLANRFVIVWRHSEQGWQIIHWQSTGVREAL
ncbi:nuclear transport factor 2 family protein [Nocardia sp. NPDC055053]